MSDPIRTISMDGKPKIRLPYESIFPFLRKALSPGPSLNQSTERFDTALINSLVHIDRPTYILDLGCGEGLILEKIQQSHLSGENSHLAAPCHYYGIDLLPEGPKWRVLKNRCQRCFPEPAYRRVDLNDHDALSKLVLDGKSFDFIFLANVLHELPPKGWPRLLTLLHTHLKPGGRLVAIDPDADWCFQRNAWTAHDSDWHLENIPVEWEAEAVWLNREGIDSVLKAIGFNATVRLYERSMTLWEATASIPDENLGPTPAQVIDSLCQYFQAKILEERVRIPGLRHELQQQLNKHGALTGEILVRAFEYFAACASQCRRLEALEDLRQ